MTDVMVGRLSGSVFGPKVPKRGPRLTVRDHINATRPPAARDIAAAGAFLSPRERQMLAGCVRAKCAKEIADALQIEPGTVRNHMNRLFEKLGVRTRLEAALWARQNPVEAMVGRVVHRGIHPDACQCEACEEIGAPLAA